MKRSIGMCLAMLLVVCVVGGALAEMPTEDRAGNPITVPEEASRIVSLAPSITQVLIDLDVADRLVAVDTYSAGTKGLPEDLDAFEMMAPDMERMVALEPDLVLVSGMSLSDGSDPFTVLTEAGICVAYIPSSDSIAGILEDTLFLGEIVGNVEGAQALCDTLTEAIARVRVETDDPLPVYFEIAPAPSLYSFGGGTFLSEMIEIVGGRNIFAEQAGWITVSDEQVVASDPAVIFTNVNWEEDAVGSILTRAGWESIAAVQNGDVFLIDADSSSQPNHRIIYALEEMAEAMEAARAQAPAA